MKSTKWGIITMGGEQRRKLLQWDNCFEGTVILWGTKEGASTVWGTQRGNGVR